MTSDPDDDNSRAIIGTERQFAKHPQSAVSWKWTNPRVEGKCWAVLVFDIFLGLCVPGVTVLNSNYLDDDLYGILFMFPNTALFIHKTALTSIADDCALYSNTHVDYIQGVSF